MKVLLTSVILVSLLALVPMNAEAKTYTVPSEYSFQYPNNWKLEERENRFSSTDASLKYGKGLTVQVQFEGITSEDAIGSTILGATDSELVDAMESALGTIYDASPYESGLDKYVVNNQTAPYALGTYTIPAIFGADIDMVAMVVAVHVSEDETLLFSYLAEEDDFDKYLPKVEQVLQSIKPVSDGTAGTETGTETGTDNSFTSQGDDLPKTKALCDTVTTQSAKDLCETLLN